MGRLSYREKAHGPAYWAGSKRHISTPIYMSYYCLVSCWLIIAFTEHNILCQLLVTKDYQAAISAYPPGHVSISLLLLQVFLLFQNGVGLPLVHETSPAGPPEARSME